MLNSLLHLILASLLWTNAQETFTFPDRELVKIRATVKDYFHPQSNAEILLDIYFANNRGLTPLLILTDEISLHMDNHEATIQTKIRKLLQLLKKVSLGLRLTAEQKDLFHERLVPMLKRYSTSPSQKNEYLVDIYNYHKLWTADDLWFLLQKTANSAEIAEFYEAFESVGKKVPPEELDYLNSLLSQAGPYTVAPMLLQYELGTLKTEQYQTLLQNILFEFRPPDKVHVETPTLSQKSLQLRLISLRVLEDLQRRYNNNEEVVVSAINKRLNKADSLKTKIFYEMFQKNDFHDLLVRYPLVGNPGSTDPLNIEKKLLDLQEKHQGPPSRVTSREENVLHLNFAPRCIDLFTL